MAGSLTTQQTSAVLRRHVLCRRVRHEVAASRFPPDIVSDEPDLIPATCPTSSCSSTPARGSSHASELTRRCDLFYLISFNCSDTLSFYISLSVCIFSIGEDAAAAAGGVRDATTRLIFNLKPSDPDSGNKFVCCVGTQCAV